jgi:RNA polymerase sigma-70 factor (ECF subfamily)
MAVIGDPQDLRDPRHFGRAFDEHAPAVHASARAVLRDSTRADDVVQDVFLRLWRAPERWDPNRGPLGAYLRLMARSRALDLWRETEVRARARHRAEEAALAERLPGAADTTEAAALRMSERESLREALAVLPPEQRRAVALAYWVGLTAEQIADCLGIPLGTAKSRIRLGLHRLRAALPAEPGLTRPFAGAARA